MSSREHWDLVYQTKTDEHLSWSQGEPATSLSLIREFCPAGRVIDIGGGSSRLAELLSGAGYDVAVLDISSAAIERSRQRMGATAEKIRWIIGDVTQIANLGAFDVWHDRAAFHFLTEAKDRAAYSALLHQSIPVGGHAIVATFALQGPEQCSGLPVRRYSGPSLAAELAMELIQSVDEQHLTPWGKPQLFQYSVLRRRMTPMAMAP